MLGDRREAMHDGEDVPKIYQRFFPGPVKETYFDDDGDDDDDDDDRSKEVSFTGL